MKRALIALVTSAAVLGMATTALACTPQEASDKFTAVTSNAGSVPSEKVGDFWQAVNAAGTLLGEEKFDEACAAYDQIMEDYGISE